jgi:ribonuclease-3
MSHSLFENLIPKKKAKASTRLKPKAEMDPARLKQLRQFSKALHIPLGDGKLLNDALTHKSYTHERKMNAHFHNEKLEFLGDSVLGLVVSEHIFEAYPEATEGGLSKVKSVVVSAQVLGEKAKLLNLGDYLLLGKGEEKSGGKNRASLLADALEALFGAVYLLGGLAPAQKLILGLLKDDVDNVFTGRMEKDYKTLLQEHIQKTQKTAPRYEIVKEWGPDHERNFEAACVVNGKTIGVGSGKSKKEAEQLAAHEAIQKLQIVVSIPSDHKINPVSD